MDRQQPFLPGLTGGRLPRLTLEVPDGQNPPADHPVEPPYPDRDGHLDPRALFADAFWGDHRRFADWAAQALPSPRSSRTPGSPQTPLTAEALRELDAHHRNRDEADRPPLLSSPTQMSTSPRVPAWQPPTPGSAETTTTRPPCPTPPSIPKLDHYPFSTCDSSHYIAVDTRRDLPPPPPSRPELPQVPFSSSSSLRSTPSTAQRPHFLHCPGYTSHLIKARSPFAALSRREEFIHAITDLETETKGVKIKGVGKLARPLLNKSHSRGLLADFLDQADRELLLPVQDPSHHHGDGEGVNDNSSSNNTQKPAPSQRALAQLESDLFDTSKYVGGSDAGNLTVLTWSEDAPHGTITLFEVDVADDGGDDDDYDRGEGAGRAARIRPVAAIEDVLRQVLVQMRVDAMLTKVVLRHDRGTAGKFRWTAQPGGGNGREAMPRCARVRTVEKKAVGAGGVGGESPRGRAGQGRRDARRRERSSLRAEAASRHVRWAPSRGTTDNVREMDGIVATIPQLMALIHASRSAVDMTSSEAAGRLPVETVAGERVRSVSFGDSALQGPRHRGRDVHVVVLVPDRARWAEERIFWTDEGGALRELWQEKYGDVIAGDRARAGTRGRDRVRARDARSLSPLGLRGKRW